MRRVKFRPGLREQQSQVARLLQFMAPGAPPEKRERAQAFADEAMASIKPKRERAAPRQLEAPVVAAISELLAVHPKVLFAVRQNTGSASYEAASGKYVPVQFYRKLTHGKEVTITDFWGFLKDGRMLAVEAKAPGFTGPRKSDDREMAQLRFLQLVRSVGGIALFADSAQYVADALA